ncbi:MAG TPA: 3-deoxy-manno-octulosonate cytidylyltransferase [Bacteroidales bacterium]|nr:3-deoxy-manno-octulosonate cytidylyltransferase [Bacteroidales bacterium]
MPVQKAIGIIPARYASARFPGKPLAMISGKTMIQRVYEQAIKASSLEDVVVATDDQRIYDHVTGFGGKVLMTSPLHPSGTDRCQEAVKILRESGDGHGQSGIVINIQGDEPFLDPGQIDRVTALFTRPEVNIATLACRILHNEELENPNVVKVVFTTDRKVLIFSRSVIPFQRQVPLGSWLDHHPYYKHIGLYGFRMAVLQQITALEPSPLEVAESLEQLRWLQNGWDIYLDITGTESVAVDTPEDLLKLANNTR